MSADFVSHLGLPEVQTLARVAEQEGKDKKGERDRLLIETLFDGCFRVSEALRIRPKDMLQSEYG